MYIKQRTAKRLKYKLSLFIKELSQDKATVFHLFCRKNIGN